MKAGIVYYTCLTHDERIERACRRQLLKSELPIVSISRGAAIDFGRNFVVDFPKGVETMHLQILEGLERSDADYVFLCENDVLYHRSHFEFVPEFSDMFYYNRNVWKMRYSDGFTFKTDDMRQVSGVCASRDVLLDFYSKKLIQIRSDGFNRHFEPGLKQSVGSKRTGDWMSRFPNICIRHNKNFTKSRFSPEEYRNKKYAKGWQETEEVSGWGNPREVLEGLLNEADHI